MRAIILAVGIAGTLMFLVWIGLGIKPGPFPEFCSEQPVHDSVSLPAGLPAPVERFYSLTYGDKVPLIRTAVISGRGTMRLFGLPIPIRFRFAHEAGQSFRHEIILTFFGLPIMRGDETFIDGRGWGKTPGGVDEGPGMDQGSNVSLWAEALNWFPAVLVTDPRVRWQSINATTALLRVPHGPAEEVFVVRFDGDSGKVQYFEAMKYKGATGRKTLWINGVWSDERRPWIRLDVEEVRLNTNVRSYIRSGKQ